MDREKLAERLVAAGDAERQVIFAQFTDLVDGSLAWSLKAFYDRVESSNPALAARAADVLTALAETTADTEVAAVAAWTNGMVALDAGQTETALRYLDASENDFLALNQPVRAAATLVSKLRALAILGRFEEALECGGRARAAFISHDDFVSAGKIEQNLGNIHFLLDSYLDAEKLYRAARQRFEIVDDQKQLAQVENCLATTLTSQHRFREAEAIYAQALTRAETAGLEVTLAEIETNQGCLALFQGHYDRALEYLERARRRFAALDMEPWSVTADQELADAYLELNLVPEAAVIYERVIPILSKLGMQTEQARALAYLGRARLELGQSSAARLLLAEAMALYKVAGNPVGEAMVILFEAQAHYAEENYAEACAAAAQTETPFFNVNAWGRLLMARWLQGDAHRAQGHLQEAEKRLKETLEQAEHWMVLPVIQRCYTSLGLLAEARGDLAAAESAFQRAIALIEGSRTPLPAEEFRVAYLADKMTPYVELVRLCLADGNPSRVAEALGYVEQARSRALVEMVSGLLPATFSPGDAFEAELFEQLEKLREELNWFYSQINRPDSETATRGADVMAVCYDAVREREAKIAEIILQLRGRNASVPIQVDPVDLTQLQADLGTHTALVEYFSLDGALLAFLVTDGGIKVMHLQCAEDEIEASLRQLHFQLGALRYGTERLRSHLARLAERTRHHLCQLYDKLLRPIEEQLDERRLLVVPHRALHYLPFHALHDGASYVIERREVCYAPSATIVHRNLAMPRRLLQRAALFGISDERTPRVREEIFALAPLFSKPTMFLDEQATRASLYENSSKADVLHLACHGRFRSDNPLFSSLQLGDGWLTVRDTYDLNLTCELVTLSACETGVSALAPGDELIGLARGFFSAGASTLLVSSWIVDDETTARLMTDFYAQLQAGDGPAAALRYAQRQLLEGYSHPYFWAPFALLGRW